MTMMTTAAEPKTREKQSETVYLDSRTGLLVTRFYDVGGNVRRLKCDKGTTEKQAKELLGDRKGKVQDAIKWGLKSIDDYERLEEQSRQTGKTVEQLFKDAGSKARQEGKTVDDVIFEKTSKAATLNSYFETYLKVKASLCKPKTVLNYRLLLEKHILPKLGMMKLSAIKASDLQSYVAERVTEEAAAESINHELNVLSGLYREAEKAGVVDRSPVHLVDRPKKGKNLVRWMSFSEEEELLPRLAGNPTLKAAVIFSIDTGLREGEQTKLTWADVDLDRQVIIVREPKNGEDREVDMTQRVYDMLKDAKSCKADALLTRYPACPYVFANMDTLDKENGGKYTRFNNGPWRKALKDAGIKSYRWHDNRHTFASRQKQMGVDDSVVMDLGGWKSPSMVRRYGHLAPKNRKSGIKALSAWRKEEAAKLKKKSS